MIDHVQESLFKFCHYITSVVMIAVDRQKEHSRISAAYEYILTRYAAKSLHHQEM